MCGIALVWRGVLLKPLGQPPAAESAGDEPPPTREQWEGPDESATAALARSGLHGAELLKAPARSDSGSASVTN
eukprot:COSAG02_NODE_2045_length_10020_cov_2.699224_5_plen_74_part_00